MCITLSYRNETNQTHRSFLPNFNLGSGRILTCVHLSHLSPILPPPSSYSWVSWSSEAGSDTVHTDLDDQRSSVSEPHRESRKSSNNNNNSRVNAAGHNMPPYEELTPIYVIKNLVVKPVRYVQLHITTCCCRHSALLHHDQRLKHFYQAIDNTKSKYQSVNSQYLIIKMYLIIFLYCSN